MHFLTFLAASTSRRLAVVAAATADRAVKRRTFCLLASQSPSTSRAMGQWLTTPADDDHVTTRKFATSSKDVSAPHKNITHVIFDLDGTLLDTEDQYFKLQKDVLERFGKEFTIEAKRKLLGLTTEDEVKSVIDMFDLKISPAEYLKLYEAEYSRYLSEGTALPGSNNLIHHFHASRVPMAICTNSTRSQLDLKTSKLFAHWRQMIPIVCAAGDDPEVKKPKPHPEAYLVTAGRFAPKPKSAAHILVFEDSVCGASAAIDAGCTVVFVAQPRFGIFARPEELENIRPRLSVVLQSLTDFVPENYGLPPYTH